VSIDVQVLLFHFLIIGPKTTDGVRTHRTWVEIEPPAQFPRHGRSSIGRGTGCKDRRPRGAATFAARGRGIEIVESTPENRYSGCGLESRRGYQARLPNRPHSLRQMTLKDLARAHHAMPVTPEILCARGAVRRNVLVDPKEIRRIVGVL
jgi:hypothetical protein